jgi:ATP-binding cassette subfamily B protein
LIPPKPYPFFFKLLWRRFRWRSFSLAIFAAGGIGLMGFEPILMRDLVEVLRSADPDEVEVWRIFTLMVAVWFASAACNRLREWVELHTAPALRLEAQQEAYQWLDQHAPRFFQDNLAGSLGQKVKQAGTASVSLLSIVFDGFVRMVVAILMAFLVLSAAPTYFFWVFLLWLVGFIALTIGFTRRCVPLFKAFGEEMSASTGVMVDICAHMDLVRGHAMRQSERGNVLHSLQAERAASIRTRRFLLWMMFVLYSALLAFQCAFIGMSLHAYFTGRMGVGEVVMVISLAAILVTNVWALSGQVTQFFEQVGILAAALAVISKPHAIAEVAEAQALQVRGGEIRFDAVRYHYRDGDVLFNGLNLKIAAGERIGLVGPSGAGKSTLTRLLRRQYDIHGGRILIDGQDIAQVQLDSLNRAIAEVPQDPALFHRSLRDNIAYARPNIDDTKLYAAVRAAHCERFIAKRPEGIEVIVGERGVRLSGGERQRVAIARAFLKDAPILILDEATSALDSETEALIQDAIDQLCEGRTVIAIAHRLSTLARMDRILVMDKGRIIEEGSHNQLLAAGGLYAAMWNRQSSGFIGEVERSGGTTSRSMWADDLNAPLATIP